MTQHETTAGHGALSGYRILDFTWSVAGPTITTLLASFGAEVIKVEWAGRVDTMRHTMVPKDVPATLDSACFFASVNPGKRGFSIDVRSEEGFEVIERLVAEVDMVTESFSAGVLERWGLTFDRMRELNPSINYLSFSGFGHSGPYRDYDSWGPTAQSYNGLTALSGLPGEAPAGIGFSYMDVMGGYHGAFAAMSAIFHQRRTGQGQYVDVAQGESGLALSGPALLNASVNGRRSGRIGVPPGNRAEYPLAAAAPAMRGEVGAPYNCYRTAGGRDWDYCAITVLTDEQWQALKRAMGDPEWADEPRFSDLPSRLANQDVLDEAIEAWTSRLDKWDLAERLQSLGVPAGPVQSFEEIVEHDPQLQHRNFLAEVEHPKLGKRRWETNAIKLSESPSAIQPTWPLLGQDNEYVLKEILGLSEHEYRELEEKHVLWPEGMPREVVLEGGLW